MIHLCFGGPLIGMVLVAAEDFVRLLTLDAVRQRDNEIRDAGRRSVLIARVAVAVFRLDRCAADAARHMRFADNVPQVPAAAPASSPATSL